MYLTKTLIMPEAKPKEKPDENGVGTHDTKAEVSRGKR